MYIALRKHTIHRGSQDSGWCVFDHVCVLFDRHYVYLNSITKLTVFFVVSGGHTPLFLFNYHLFILRVFFPPFPCTIQSLLIGWQIALKRQASILRVKNVLTPVYLRMEIVLLKPLCTNWKMKNEAHEKCESFHVNRRKFRWLCIDASLCMQIK